MPDGFSTISSKIEMMQGCGLSKEAFPRALFEKEVWHGHD